MRRNQSLDIVKGFLVCVMLAYHSATLFVDTDELRKLLLTHVLGYVSGSWIFISGLIIAAHYSESFTDDPRAVSKRLIVRGLKLLALVMACNVLIGNVQLSFTDGAPSLQPHLIDLLFLIPPTSAHFSFEILVGIGYLLTISPLFLINARLGVILSLVLVLVGISAMNSDQPMPAIVWMLSCGVAGILGGYVVKLATLKLLTQDENGVRTLLAATVVVIAADLWFTWDLYLSRNFLANYIFRIVYVLGIIYLVAEIFRPRGRFVDALCLLARYSLFAYMWQMVLIRAWYVAFGNSPVFGNYVIVLAVIFAGLVASVALLDTLRRKSPLVNRLYAGVFL